MRRKYQRKNPGRGYDENVRACYDRREPSSDYLKYFRIVRYWAKRTQGIGLADLEMLLFLYSERLFSRNSFNEFEEIFPWDASRFERLRKDGWISVWRKAKGNESALYEISFKGKRLILSVYKKLAGEEPISESQSRNVIFKKNSPYTDKVYRRAIKTMNKSTAQLRHPSQE